MKYTTDEAVAEELARVGRLLRPRPDGLRTALRTKSSSVPSPLSFITIMSTYTKIGATLVAILVVAGGAYYVAQPSGELALQQETQSTESADTTSAKMMVSNDAAVPPADDSFDGFEAAMDADLAAQHSALSTADAEADAKASSVSSVNNNPTYNENDI